MSFIRPIIGFLVIIALALLLGWTERSVKHPAAHCYSWLGAILLLLILGCVL